MVRITKAQLASEVAMWKRRGERAMGARMVSQVLQNLRITNILIFCWSSVTGLGGKETCLECWRGEETLTLSRTQYKT